MHKIQSIIAYLFIGLFFLVPLILWPYTSEIFEFNKILVVYSITTFISALWIVRIVNEKKIIFRRTLLDIPILIFLLSQLLSTIFSQDIRTSFFGYYSRFNGGLLSSFCYSLLYWAYVSNMTRKNVINSVYSLIVSASLVSVYGILERFGIDKDIWVQDVVNRVFSTLGQPNWLAAFLAALIPLTFGSFVKKPYSYFFSTLFFITLLLTKSRSGILGFGIAEIIYWGYLLIKYKEKYLKEFLIFNGIFLSLFLIIKTPFTQVQTQVPVNAPALEVGGTESGDIRKIVWKGAINLWKKYPITGSGLETFAYTYYQVRPVEHNLVSEWDFIYNKAHNEYLNFLATSGTLGTLAYLILLGFIIFAFVKKLDLLNFTAKKEIKDEIKTLALLSGIISLLISNFFGFSVVITQLQLFLYPAFVLALGIDEQQKQKDFKYSYYSLIPLGVAFIIFVLIVNYWRADVFYNKARSFNKTDEPDKALENINKAISLSPNEPIYHLELAESYTKKSLAIDTRTNNQQLNSYLNTVTQELNKAQELSPNNVNIKRFAFSSYIRLSLIDNKYLIEATKVLEEAIIMAPTDAKILYNLGLCYARLGKADEALKYIQKAVEYKANYKEARLAYAFLLIDQKKTQQAKEQFEYILNNIDPTDTISKQQLEELK